MFFSCLFGRAVAAPILGQIFYIVLSTCVADFALVCPCWQPGWRAQSKTEVAQKPSDFLVTSILKNAARGPSVRGVHEGGYPHCKRNFFRAGNNGRGFSELLTILEQFLHAFGFAAQNHAHLTLLHPLHAKNHPNLHCCGRLQSPTAAIHQRANRMEY